MTYEMSDLDYAHHLLGDTIDLDAQLLAMRSLLRRNRDADSLLEREIREIAESAKTAKTRASWSLDDLWVDHLHHSVYQDAAHSMAAVGMLAPLLETVFVRIFAAVGGRPDWPAASAVRLDRAGSREAPGFWSPQVYFSKGREPKNDLILGIRQLALETGLADELPADYLAVVRALFSYRNRMFHNGLEWPVDQRETFDHLIETERWPSDWFTRSTSGGATWIIYMDDAFTNRCLAFVGEVLEAAGRFARQRFDKFGYTTEEQPLPPAWMSAVENSRS